MTRSADSTQEKTPMRRVLGNLGFLLKGRGIAAVMMFGTITLMARALGPAEFGIVVLIQTYVLLIRGLLNFKQFEAIIRYGVPALDANDNRTLTRLIRICRRVDKRASITATIVALILAPLIGPMMGMDQQHVILLGLYSLVLITTGNRTDIGILRLFDQYHILGKQMVIGPVIRFVGVVLAWWFGSPLYVYIAILAVSFIIEELYLSCYGRREYRNRLGEISESTNDASLSEFSGMRKFLWITYWQSNVDLVPKHITVMLAGYLLGASEAGLLRLARQFSSLLSKPAVLIRQVVFPDLTRSWEQGNNHFKLITYRTALFGGGIGMLFVSAGYFFGEALLALMLGLDFVAAAPVLTLMLLAATFELTASPLRSAAYAVGRAGTVLRIYMLSSVIYLTLFTVLTCRMGLIGTGIAASIAAVIPPLIMVFLIKKSTAGKST